MNYYAHTSSYSDGTARPEDEWQPLREHLENVADTASYFALDGFKNCAYIEGLLHDVGKYQESFQGRLRGSTKAVDHAVCGAKEAETLFDLGNGTISDFMSRYLGDRTPDEQKKIVSFLRTFALGNVLAYTIIGHHSGLPDKGTKGENADPTVLLARIGKATEPYDAYKTEIDMSSERVRASVEEIINFIAKKDFKPYSDYEFLIRYLYSCLVDADFLDTEKFCKGPEFVREEYFADWEECGRVITSRFASFAYDTKVNMARKKIRDQAMSLIRNDSGIYFLDMPTGSGKTLCSVALAVERIRSTGKKRIIYVIPYTTIIEQTASVMEELFPNLTVLQHHCNFDFDESEEDSDDVSATAKLKKATENWDVPMVITTNVQFFESIYSNRAGKLRKMHNMADSVLIFDEMHTLPLKCFAPCMTAIKQLTTNFGSEAIFLTATMPDFAGLVKKFTSQDFKTYDLVPDKSEYALFRNVTYENVGKTDVPEVLDPSVSNLVVCNRKKTALEYYRRYEGENKYYLSTYMTPIHRSAVIGKIRDDLASGKKPVVFSTSLIEAGVDLDFDCAWRELSGLDSVLQTAGRCNREGKRDKESSKVCIFESDFDPSGDLAIRAHAAKGCMDKYGMDNLAEPECVRDYYDRVYGAEDNVVGKGGEYISDSFNVNFKEIAEKFHMIDAVTEGIVVPDEEILGPLRALRHGGMVSKRKLQKHTASVNKRELDTLISLGVVRTYDGVNVLEDGAYYDADTGIIVDEDTASVYIY
ncbi:MAG: CRISPR-associated helicase Cas3' [Bacteroidales bacterium]|nr:CRISPR-associated helicase Cas3' [Bacteroidales bacterium]